MQQKQDSLLFAKLNSQTAQIPWQELQRFFAQGKVLIVNKDKDLISVAESIANDQSQQVENLIASQSIKPVSDGQAKGWIENDSLVWAVVVAPWILVQEISNDNY